MKLLLMNYEFPPMGGGAGHATYNIALELARMGHSVDVLTSRYGRQDAEESVRGVRVYRVFSWRHGIHNAGLMGALSYLLCAFFKLRILIRENRYDMVHYFFSLPTGLLSFYSHGVKKLPYIVSLRGSDVPDFDPSDRVLRLLHRFLKPVNMAIWKHARKVIANSRGLRDLALRASPDQPIGVVCNGIDPGRFPPGAFGKNPSNGTRLICVSRLIGRKGLESLIDGVALVKDAGIRLEIVGTGSSEHRLKRRVGKLGMEERVRFSGYRSNSDLADSYREADIFVQTSLSESINMALLEAMSCGLPVIATNVGGVPEVVKDGENGLLVEPGNSRMISDAIRRLAEDAPLREKLSRNNAAKIREQFTWDSAAKKYHDIYAEAAVRSSKQDAGIGRREAPE